MMTTKLATESVTFRLDSDAVQALKKRAIDDRITLSTLVNQIVTDYLEWEGNWPVSSRFVVIERNALKDIVESADKNTLKRSAVNAATRLTEAALTAGGKTGIESALKIFKHTVRKSRFSLIEQKVDGQVVYVIRHDMGKKWSDFCKEQIERMMLELGRSVKIETTEAILTITLPSVEMRE